MTPCLISARPRDAKGAVAERGETDRLTHPVWDLHPRGLGDWTAGLEDDLGHEALQVREKEQIGLVAGGDRAEMVEAVPASGVERAEHERVLGSNPERDRVPDDRIDVAVVGDVLGLAVICAERDAVGVVLLHQRQQGAEVSCSGGLAVGATCPPADARGPPPP